MSKLKVTNALLAANGFPQLQTRVKALPKFKNASLKSIAKQFKKILPAGMK